MNYEKAFKYVFEDPDWVGKALLFVVMLVLQFLIIPIFIFNGYFIKTMKGISMGEEGLPKWDDWGDLIGIGFKLFVVQLILMLPAAILFGIFVFPAIMSAASVGQQAYPGMAYPPAFGMMGAGAFLGILIAGIYALAAACVFPAMAMRFAAEDYSIGAAFKFAEVFKVISENTSDYVSSVAIFIGLTIAASIIGGATMYLGTFILYPYVYLVTAHLFGQVMRRKPEPVPA